VRAVAYGLGAGESGETRVSAEATIMNAPNPTPGEREFEALRRAQRAHEPSMEEILASIRAIIADDREAVAAKPAPAVANVPTPTLPQIVVSNDAPQVAKPAAEFIPPRAEPTAEPAPAPNVVWARPRVEPAPEPEPNPEAATAETSEPEAERGPELVYEQINEPPLLSDETDRAVAASFEALTASVAMQSAELVDRLTKEMLRPMIKSWLDEHLPSMVERLVRAEIQRVARGGR